jgi:hypothetical protein
VLCLCVSCGPAFPSYSFAIERGTIDGDNIAEMGGGVPRHSPGLVYVHCVIDMIATAAQHIYSIEGCIFVCVFL